VTDAAIEIRGLRRAFGENEALRDVSLSVRPGEIHALLGPNGAGKTTLLRILTGLVAADGGEVTILGRAMDEIGFRAYYKQVGLVPSGDRSFYLRISGFENLLFFARLQGLRRREAAARAMELIRDVGLEDAAKRPVGLYSHGMQKRLSVARGLLTAAAVLLVDEATHDLDPEGARRVQDLVEAAARRGTAIIWTTQRLDEIRGFADQVTVLDHGLVRFQGTVPALMARSIPRRYVLRLRHATDALEAARGAVAPVGEVMRGAGEIGDHYVLVLTDGVSLGDALGRLVGAGVEIIACTEERSGLEDAFLNVVRGTTT